MLWRISQLKLWNYDLPVQDLEFNVIWEQFSDESVSYLKYPEILNLSPFTNHPQNI